MDDLVRSRRLRKNLAGDRPVRHFHGVGRPARRILIGRAAATSSLLSLLFVVVYGGTNWFTAQRAAGDVPTWCSSWELTTVPFLPLLIVPYMSLDVFFFLATFLCQDERELRIFAKRIMFSVLVAGAFFLILPLKLDWPHRPRVEGWFGEFVHCKIGYSRSAAAVAAYLLASGQVRRIDEAIGQLRAARPSIIIRPEVMEALRSFSDSAGLVRLRRRAEPQMARAA